MRQYRCGFCYMPLYQMSYTDINEIRKAALECDRFIMGIPDDTSLGRLYGDSELVRIKETVELWKDISWVSQIIEIKPLHMKYKDIYNDIHFDMFLYGHRYGRLYEEDRLFFENEGVSMISLEPSGYNGTYPSALRLALEDVRYDQKIVLFGTGKYFDIYMDSYGDKYKPDYAVDNDSAKWNTSKNGIAIKSPDVLKDERTDNILIVVCAKNAEQLIEQIKNYGEHNYRTLAYDKYLSLFEEYAITITEENDYLIEARTVLSDLLKEFDRIAIKHNIRYYVICGTLIGALRHHGFIPWDDDIDVAVPREDYERLKTVLADEIQPDEYRFVDWDELGGGAFLDTMPRIYDMRHRLTTKVFTKVRGRATADLDGRPFLDIYPMANAYNSELKHKIQAIRLKLVYNLLMGHRGYIDYSEYTTHFNAIQIGIMRLIHRIGACIPLKTLACRYDRIAQGANRIKNCKDYIMKSCAITVIDRRYPKNNFGIPQRERFDDFELSVPENCEGVFSSMNYHDIMNYPPHSIRKPSHYFNSDIEIWR